MKQCTRFTLNTALLLCLGMVGCHENGGIHTPDNLDDGHTDQEQSEGTEPMGSMPMDEIGGDPGDDPGAIGDGIPNPDEIGGESEQMEQAGPVPPKGADKLVGSASCLNFEACGGDPTGTWTLGNWCGAPLIAEPKAPTSCPDAWVSDHNYWISGEISFAADGSYEITTEQEFETLMIIPAACRQDDSCLPFEEELNAKSRAAGISHWECQPSAMSDDCACFSREPTNGGVVHSDYGKWSPRDSRPTISIESENPPQRNYDLEFCMQDGKMAVRVPYRLDYKKSHIVMFERAD